MATLKKYDLLGKEVGTVQVDDAHLETKAHPQLIKDYLVAIRNNARQWSAHTKTRAEIQRTGRKPHAQKGMGRSRQGDLAAPHYTGGGIVFGPRAKGALHVRINQKERRAAIRSLLVEKVKENCVCVLKKEQMKQPKTRKLAAFFGAIEMADQRVLVLGEKGKNAHENLVKSLRNLPKKEYLLAGQVDGYSLARCRQLIVLESALEEFLSVLGVSS